MRTHHLAEIRQCLEKGLRFLDQSRTRSGWWLDFRTSEGVSDEWVTAYVGSCLAGSTHPLAETLARSAWDLLRRRRWWLPGWAYNFGVPLDADSTIWAIRLAESLEAENRRVPRAYRFLARHRSPSAGISTYAGSSPIYRHIYLKYKAQCAGWMASHVCVTAAATNLARIPERDGLYRYLLHEQTGEGFWIGYWWADPEYPTGLVLEALRRFPPGDLHMEIQAAAPAYDWLAGRLAGGYVSTAIHSHGSPFATACALKALAFAFNLSDQAETMTNTVSWLLDAQFDDGSWESSARLRLPPPDVSDPEQVETWAYTDDMDSATVKLDQNRVYTTATVVAALAAVLSVQR